MENILDSVPKKKEKLLVLDSYFYDGSPVLTAVQIAPQGRNWKVLAVNAGSNIIGNKKINGCAHQKTIVKSWKLFLSITIFESKIFLSNK